MKYKSVKMQNTFIQPGKLLNIKIIIIKDWIRFNELKFVVWFVQYRSIIWMLIIK